MINRIEELEKIKSLKDMGSITETEFEIEKQKILNSEVNNQSRTEGIFIASLILGICSLLFGIIPILGLILSIVSLIICIISKRKLKVIKQKNGMVTAGIILTIIGLVLALIVTIILPIGTVVLVNDSSPKEVKIPNVVGLSVEQAKEEIEKANLQFEMEKEEYNSDVDKGYVISQYPIYEKRFNKVKENSTISVIVSKGFQKVIVPNVKGKQKENAIKLIEDKDLKVQIIEEKNKTVKEGYVISQEIEANTEVNAGDIIVIHISI